MWVCNFTDCTTVNLMVLSCLLLYGASSHLSYIRGEILCIIFTIHILFSWEILLKLSMHTLHLIVQHSSHYLHVSTTSFCLCTTSDQYFLKTRHVDFLHIYFTEKCSQKDLSFLYLFIHCFITLCLLLLHSLLFSSAIWVVSRISDK